MKSENGNELIEKGENDNSTRWSRSSKAGSLVRVEVLEHWRILKMLLDECGEGGKFSALLDYIRVMSIGQIL